MVAIIGGAFDPIHYGHLEIANVLLSDFDKIYYVPSQDVSPWGKKTVASFKMRYKMVETAVKSFFDEEACVFVSDIEKKRNFQYSYETYEHFRTCEDFPHDAYWVIGSDRKESDFKNHDKMKFLRIGRPGFSCDCKYYININISSTKIRDTLSNAGTISGCFVPEDVLRFIYANKLYQK